MLAEAGLAPDAVRAMLDFDVANFQWHRVVTKGEFVSFLLSRIGLDLEGVHLQGLTAIVRIRCGVGRAATEPTIGLVAEDLSLDPSRASRIVADLVARGLVLREAAQEDGRKSVLSLTPAGRDVLDRFRREKWAVMAKVFADWEPAKIAHFASGIRAYTEAVQSVIAELTAEAT
jgi:DNA-binding MarR family transcriptional regulator